MAINRAMQAALKAISYMDLDVEKSYKLSRKVTKTLATLYLPPKDYVILDHKVMNGDHQVPVRVFTHPKAAANRVLLFFHGGGWITGDIDTYSRTCVDLCEQTGLTVISVDYRLSPEHRFPTALEDCYGVLRELSQKKIANIQPEEIILIGDSAGGNLAAALSLMARDRGDPLPKGQILIYPATYNDHSETSPYPSVMENGSDYFLTSKRVRDYLSLYRSSEEDLENPYFAPILAESLDHQPDTLIITAEFCPLRDEGEHYGRLLAAAGNQVTVHRVKDALHGFFTLPPHFKHVTEAYAVMHQFLSEVTRHETECTVESPR